MNETTWRIVCGVFGLIGMFGYLIYWIANLDTITPIGTLGCWIGFIFSGVIFDRGLVGK